MIFIQMKIVMENASLTQHVSILSCLTYVKCSIIYSMSNYLFGKCFIIHSMWFSSNIHKETSYFEKLLSHMKRKIILVTCLFGTIHLMYFIIYGHLITHICIFYFKSCNMDAFLFYSNLYSFIFNHEKKWNVALKGSPSAKWTYQ